jgi:hypothetical protein
MALTVLGLAGVPAHQSRRSGWCTLPLAQAMPQASALSRSRAVTCSGLPTSSMIALTRSSWLRWRAIPGAGTEQLDAALQRLLDTEIEPDLVTV